MQGTEVDTPPAKHLSSNLWETVNPQRRTENCKGSLLNNGCPGPWDEEGKAVSRAKRPETERDTQTDRGTHKERDRQRESQSGSRFTEGHRGTLESSNGEL